MRFKTFLRTKFPARKWVPWFIAWLGFLAVVVFLHERNFRRQLAEKDKAAALALDLEQQADWARLRASELEEQEKTRQADLVNKTKIYEDCLERKEAGCEDPYKEDAPKR